MQTDKLVVIGCSMGGLTALEELLSSLPGDFPTPVAVVMHRSVQSTGGLVQLLRKYTRLRIKEPVDKEQIQPGHIYIAPADYHLMVEDGGFALSTDAPELYARPSIDVLFESAADAYGARAVAVVMTGASSDGSRGAAAVKAAGGAVIVQDPTTAESPLMPQSAIRAITPDRVVTIPQLAKTLMEFCYSGEMAEASRQPSTAS
jgi:two-component system chemotaxis response regulator CheB